MPEKENDPRPNTKPWLGAVIKAEPAKKLKLKKQYENVNLEKINL